MVWKVGWPAIGYSAPAEIRAAGQVLHLRGPIPRCAHVKLRVRIIRERLAIGVKGNAVGVAHAAAEDFLFRTVGIHADHVAFIFAKRLECFTER